MSIGTRIKAVRKAAGLSQEELARRAALSLNGFADIERGAIKDPHYSSLRKIADALGVPIGELLEEESLFAGKGDAPESGHSEEAHPPAPEEEARRLRDSFEPLVAIMDAASDRWERAVAAGEVGPGVAAESAAIERLLAEKMEEAKRDAAAAGLLDRRGRLPTRIIGPVQSSYKRWWDAAFHAEGALLESLEGTNEPSGPLAELWEEAG